MSWWTLHQLIVALSYWFMVWPAWHVHKWTGRYGVLTFLATLAIVIIGGNVRLHLWFTARTYPAELASQLAKVAPPRARGGRGIRTRHDRDRSRHRRRVYRLERPVRVVRPGRRARISGDRTGDRPRGV